MRLSRSSSPIVVALAGPNGAGRSTAGPALLRETLRITEFVNADVIARGLSAFAPEKAAIGEIIRNGRLIDEAMKRAAREAWLLHKRAGIPVPVWRNGRTIFIHPKDIKLPSMGRVRHRA